MNLSSLWRRTSVFAIAAFLLLCPSATSAAVVEFVATNLPDNNPGQDLWRYDYTVRDRDFVPTEFFDIHFDPLTYGLLSSSVGPADWDTRILEQPDSTKFPPFDLGLYNSMALSDTTGGAFSVDFIYRGTGSPGSQRFEIYDTVFKLVESGQTRPPDSDTVIPEPSTGALILLALAFGGLRFARTRNA